MTRLSTFAIGLVFAAVFAVSAYGQAAPSKIGWIDTGAFGDEKEGVTKYVNALKALDAEMKPQVTALQGMQAKIQAISNEIKEKSSNPAVPVDTKALQAKQDEGLSLQRTFEFKKKEYDAAVEKRSGEVLGPVSADISKAIDAYAKQKGYAVVLDIAALANANAILALDPTANITKDFITYYNTRPAGTASTAKP